MLCCEWLVFNCCDMRFFILAVAVSCFPRHWTPVIGYPCFWNFHSTLPVDVVSFRWTCFFDPACLTISKLWSKIRCLVVSLCFFVFTGDRFRSVIDETWWAGEITDRSPFQTEFVESHFQCFTVT